MRCLCDRDERGSMCSPRDYRDALNKAHVEAARVISAIASEGTVAGSRMIVERLACYERTIARLRGELAEARTALAKAWDDGHSSSHPGRVNPYVAR